MYQGGRAEGAVLRAVGIEIGTEVRERKFSYNVIVLLSGVHRLRIHLQVQALILGGGVEGVEGVEHRNLCRVVIALWRVRDGMIGTGDRLRRVDIGLLMGRQGEEEVELEWLIFIGRGSGREKEGARNRILRTGGQAGKAASRMRTDRGIPGDLGRGRGKGLLLMMEEEGGNFTGEGEWYLFVGD